MTHLDHQSRELFPSIQATPPTKEALFAAVDALNRHVDAARRQGRTTLLYIFYSGRGELHQGEGRVQLDGSKLTRADLLALLRRSRAHSNHVIIDACKSYFVVFRRGPGGRRRRAAGSFLPPERAVPANTGFLLSTSAAQDSHEWEAFQAGIFSHEVRSALSGAADVNADGIVSYEEASAFIYTANKSVPNRRFRPRFLSRPQAGKRAARAALVDLRHVTTRRIRFGAKLAGRHYIEDQMGLRLVDLHLSRNRSATVLVPRSGRLFVRIPRGDMEYVVPEGTLVSVADLRPRRVTIRSRGAEHEAFVSLFARPFDEPALAAYRTRTREAVDDSPVSGGPSAADRYLRPALGIFALVALATGGLFTGLAVRERSSVDESTSNAARQEVNAVIERNNAIAVSAYIVGAAAAAGYLTWTLWPEPRIKVQVCLWEGYAVELTASGVHASEVSFSSPGTWRLVAPHGVGCTKGKTLSQAGCSSMQTAFSKSMTVTK